MNPSLRFCLTVWLAVGASAANAADFPLSPNPNPDASYITINSGDVGYNDAPTDFRNTGVIDVKPGGRLWNQAGDSLTNDGGIYLFETVIPPDRGVFLNEGQYTQFGYSTLRVLGSVENYGTMTYTTTYSASALEVGRFGNIYNGATGTVIGSDARSSMSIALGGIVDNEGTWSHAGQLTLEGLLQNFPSGTFNLTGSLTNTGQVLNNGQIVNDGGRFEIGGFATVSGAGGYTQNSGKTIVNGTMSQGEVHNNGGIFAGSGTVHGDFYNDVTDLVDVATLAPGDPVTLTIDGNLYFNSGVIDIQIAGLNDLDQLLVTGLANLKGGTLRFEFIGGYAPSMDDTFDFLVANGGAEFTGDWLYEITGLEEGFEFSVDRSGGQLTMMALNDGVSSVPAPGAAWLLGTALAGLGGRRWLRRKISS